MIKLLARQLHCKLPNNGWGGGINGDAKCANITNIDSKIKFTYGAHEDGQPTKVPTNDLSMCKQLCTFRA
jgi:hypothetical protein